MHLTNTYLLQHAVFVGVGQSQAPLTQVGWGPHSDPELTLGVAQLSGGQTGPPVACRSVALIEECCSWSSEGSAEMEVGQESVCYVGLVVKGHKKPVVAQAGTEASLCSAVGLVAVLAVIDSAVLLLAFSSPDLLGPSR